MLSLPDDVERRSWFFLDEFHTFEAIPQFDTLVTNARSKGACIVIGFQNISTLIARYKERATAIIGECKNKMFFRASSHEHAEWAAKEYGEHEFYKETEDSTTNQQVTCDGVKNGRPYGVKSVSVTHGTSRKGDFQYTYADAGDEWGAAFDGGKKPLSTNGAPDPLRTCRQGIDP